MAKETTGSKWEGKSIAELRSIKAEQVWPYLEDFCNFHKWLPAIDTCRHVQGVYGQPGLIRYCSSSSPSSPFRTNQTPTNVVKWGHEKLLSIDPIERRLMYEILENNVGFTTYVAELKVIEMKGGCRIEWSFRCDPVEGWKLEDLCGYLGSCLEGMAERLEKEVQTATN